MSRPGAVPLLIRADASEEIGTGHVMRCLALAQAWQEAGGEPCFAWAGRTPALEKRLEGEGVPFEHLDVAPGSDADRQATLQLARRRGAGWVVVDGYHFDSAYQQGLRSDGARLLVLDDYGQAARYVADLVLNQNLHASAELYAARESKTSLLLGPRYALLRREFWSCPERRQPANVARLLLVSLGGADPENVTLMVLHALQKFPELEAVVLVGACNPHRESLEAAAQHAGRVRLEANVTNMPELMAWADLAVTAGGSTAWELARMGLPALMVVLADNQRAVARSCHDAGLARNLGWHADVSAEAIAAALASLMHDAGARGRMSAAGRELVDGQGARRVRDAMLGVVP
jgi:UDP-2,4-diacetamido-2,4,6-trideoxy-beta-L-altropyranose hydrolase